MSDIGMDTLLTELKLKAFYCDFGDTDDLMFRQKCAFKVSNHTLTEKLLGDLLQESNIIIYKKQGGG